MTDDRLAWLTERRTGIGSSDIAGIMGVSPWQSPLSVWLSKVDTDPISDDDHTPEQEWGLRLEDAIIAKWCDENGMQVWWRNRLERHPDEPWMIATPDAIVSDIGDVEAIILEAKTTDDWTWDEVPAHYDIQVQWQLAVTGLPRAVLAVLHGGRRYQEFPIEADPDKQAALIEAGREFWTLVESDTPPPLTLEDAPYLASLWPQSTDAQVDVGDELAYELRNAKEAAKEAQKRLEAAEFAVKAFMGESGKAVAGDWVVATWNTSSTSRIDVKRLRAEHPNIADEYTTESTVRRFLIKGVK